MTYVAAEPEEMTAFKDQNGRLHHSRDAAIASNFNADLQLAVAAVIRIVNEELPPVGTLLVIKRLAQDKPDLLRVLVGDRDAT